MLANAHSFKDKKDNLSYVNVGLFIYPVLMAADIILYDADYVPVGKDQKQHLEIARDIAKGFNRHYGPTFVVPKPKINSTLMVIPGTDGRKMSKSYGNYIDIFETKEKLKKQIMSILTDSKTVQESKNPETCNVFRIYHLLASKKQSDSIKKNYLIGNYGYAQAKKALLELIQEKFSKERAIYTNYINHTELLEEELQEGENKARKIARKVLNRIKEKLRI